MCWKYSEPHASGNTLFFIYNGTNTYVTRNIIMFYHNVATVIIPTRCPATALENASPTRKGLRRCANRLMGSYSHM